MAGRFVFLVAIAGFVACAAPRSERCKRICELEAQCIEADPPKDITFDKNDCIVSCSAFDRDEPVGKTKIDEHEACVKKAKSSCDAVFACMRT